jgi:hypothetical protein
MWAGCMVIFTTGEKKENRVPNLNLGKAEWDDGLG